MKTDRINILLEKYAGGRLTEDERSELYQLLTGPDAKEFEEVMVEHLGKSAEQPIAIDEGKTVAMFTRIVAADKQEDRAEGIVRSLNTSRRVRRWMVAASVVLLMGTGTFLWLQNQLKPIADKGLKKQLDIPSGKNGAVLTLADGSQVVLDSLHNGVIAQQNGTQVMLNGGQLAYDPSKTATVEVTYNVLNTPRGRQFQLTLPDGTKVWLNSASSLKFPTVFSGKERKVELKGEAYFEVAKDVHKPFVVSASNKAEVKVLGTAFDINAYENEDNLRTTLLEGSVKVTGSGPLALNSDAVVLRPRQQAQITQTGDDIVVVNNVDVNKVVAWKNGVFNFEGLSFTEVMKQLERWYDIQVVFEGEVPKIEFYGELNRNNSLGDLLDALKDSDVNFRMEGKKLIVTK
jgi:ferric-dicitrate binding protein FerR (iron transport regulator)